MRGRSAGARRRLVARRFLRHRPAAVALGVLLAVVLLAVTSIGAAGLPGWWGPSWTTTGDVVGGGRPTLSLWPRLLGGHGLALGAHPFGQDDVGRDYFALTMRGTQRSLVVALLAGLVGTALGVTVGALAGWFGGVLDGLLMRVVDLVLSIPLLVVAAVVARVAHGSAVTLALLLGAVVWTPMARLVRGEVVALREREFVLAARATGASARWIVTRHLLPGAAGTILANASLTVAAVILLESGLSYVGLGVHDPDTSLGLLVSDYQSAFSVRPWLFWWPGVFVVVIALAVNVVGDGLRHAFDPRGEGPR